MQVIALFFCCWQCLHTAGCNYLVPPATLQVAPYAEWAHHHWVWLSYDRASQESMLKYVEDYLSHGVQVGAVDIDSEWATGFNNFVFDPKKYPDPSDLIESLHIKKIRIILWVTSMIDTDSSNFNDTVKFGFLVRNTLGEPAMVKWWHGTGGFLDYTNPVAVMWWHSQMDKVLEMGIDGWKCDGTDPFILEVIDPTGHDGKLISRREYSNAYYGDFFDYTRKRYGDDKLIMSRPVDGYPPIYLDFSPRRVMLSGWVGDADPDFKGLENTLKFYLQSAWAGYANFGSDIGGYRTDPSNPLGRTKEVFIRWSQLGAFSPLMENGGNMEHRPWKFDSTNETLDIYKKFVNTHYQLVPYLLTTGSKALETNGSSLRPLAARDNFINKLIDDFRPSTYDYLLGDSILVSPLYSEGSVNTSVMVHLPDNRTWVYWWDHSKEFSGTAEISRVPLEEYPVFFLKGSIIPLRISNQTSPLPSRDVSRFYLALDAWPHCTDCLRWLLHVPACDRSTHLGEENRIRREVREDKGHGIIASYWWESCDCLAVAISAHPTIHSLVHLAGLPRLPHLVHSQAAGRLRLSRKSTLIESVIRLGEEGSGSYVHLNGAKFSHVLIDPSVLYSWQGHQLHICF